MTLAHTAASPSHAARGRAPREMPVLFHLFDVSTPKGFAAPHPSAEDETPAEEQTTEELLAAAVPEASLPVELPPPAPAAEHPATAPASEPVAEAKPNPTDTTPPADDAVSVRQRIEERSRKRQTAAKADWFGLHGKYIAIGFVLMLLLTIYLARWHKRSPQPPVAEPPPHAHPGDAAAASPAIVVEMPKAVGHEHAHASSPAVGVTTPDAAPAESPAVELHMPTTTAPQLAQQPEAAKPAEQKPDEGLFPWAKQNEERVATRPERPALSPSVAPTTTPAPAEAARPSAYPAPVPSLPAAPPADEPRYPTTNSRSQFQPAAAPQSPPPTEPVGGGAFVPAASSEPSYPTTSTASGTRYERTGSGLY